MKAIETNALVGLFSGSGEQLKVKSARLRHATTEHEASLCKMNRTHYFVSSKLPASVIFFNRGQTHSTKAKDGVRRIMQSSWSHHGVVLRDRPPILIHELRIYSRFRKGSIARQSSNRKGPMITQGFQYSTFNPGECDCDSIDLDGIPGLEAQRLFLEQPDYVRFRTGSDFKRIEAFCKIRCSPWSSRDRKEVQEVVSAACTLAPSKSRCARCLHLATNKDISKDDRNSLRSVGWELNARSPQNVVWC